MPDGVDTHSPLRQSDDVSQGSPRPTRSSGAGSHVPASVSQTSSSSQSPSPVHSGSGSGTHSPSSHSSPAGQPVTVQSSGGGMVSPGYSSQMPARSSASSDDTPPP